MSTRIKVAAFQIGNQIIHLLGRFWWQEQIQLSADPQCRLLDHQIARVHNLPIGVDISV